MRIKKNDDHPVFWKIDTWNRNDPTWIEYRIFDVDEKGDCHFYIWKSDYKSLDWLKEYQK